VKHARYTLKIVVLEGSVTLDFELGTNDDQYGAYAPETEIPKIRASFQSIAAQVAKSVNGTLE